MNYRTLIQQNCVEINRLKKQIDKTFNVKNKKEDWSNACREFHENYNNLCYWNGIHDYRSEIRNGNQKAIEYYITFIEIRPYFFRSGYMFQDLMRVFKNVELSKDHKTRYEIIKTNYLIYKENRKKEKS